jgi:hypothetical protein
VGLVAKLYGAALTSVYLSAEKTPPLVRSGKSKKNLLRVRRVVDATSRGLGYLLRSGYGRRFLIAAATGRPRRLGAAALVGRARAQRIWLISFFARWLGSEVADVIQLRNEAIKK